MPSAEYPTDLRSPADTQYERSAPRPLQVCRTTGVNERGGGNWQDTLRVAVRVPDSRVWVSISLVFEPESPDPGALNFGVSTLWTCERSESDRGMVPVANVRGTSLAPQAWPLPGLQGSLDEGITTAEEVLLTLALDAAFLPAGRVVCRCKFESTVRLTHAEWQRVISEAGIRKVGGVESLCGNPGRNA